MPVCAVLGCNSHSEINTDYTFHQLPRALLSRARWLLAIGPRTAGRCPLICSRHFEDAMFVERGGTRVLVKNAVPTLFLPPKIQQQSASVSDEPENSFDLEKISSMKTELAQTNRALRTTKTQIPQIERPKIKRPVKGASDDLLACRVCLAVDVPLYNIKDIGFEGSFAELTGVPLSAAAGFPRRLCGLCRAQLSKCAAFRGRCRRSHSLLQTLLERGPLKLNDIKAIDRHSHKLTSNLTLSKTYNFQNHPVLEITPEDNDKTSRMVPEPSVFTEIEYLEDYDCIGNDTKNEDTDISDEKNEIRPRFKRVKLEHKNSDQYFETENCINIEPKSTTDDDGTDTSRKQEEIQVKGNKQKLQDEIIPMDILKYFNTEDCIDVEMKDDSDVDTDSSEEIVELRNKIKRKLGERISTKTTNILTKPKNTESHCGRGRKKIGDDYYPNFDYELFEKEFNVKIKFLTREEQKQEIEDRKTANKTKFCCEMCGKGYNHEATIKKHLKIHDPSSGPYECDICHYRFQVNKKMLPHRDTHRLAFACGRCNCVSRSRTNARAHFLMHEGKTYKCRHCAEVFNYRTSYFNHMRTQHPGMNVACDECGETFLSVQGVRMHKDRGHRNENLKTEFKCSVCDFAFLSSAALDKHTMVAGDMSHAALWPCAACGDSCGSHAAQLAHVAERHPTDQLRCEECDSTFASAASFDLHVKRKHLGVRASAGHGRRGAGPMQPVVCEVCGRVVKNSTLLRYHMNGHLSVKPYPCPKCPKAFAQKFSRTLHMRVHTGERPYQCEQCPLTFALKCNLIRHRKQAHDEHRKPVPCELCHKTFKSRVSMKHHVRFVHSDEPWPRRVRTPNKTTADT